MENIIVSWPDKERRQDYVELLITLNADMKGVKDSIEKMTNKLESMNRIMSGDHNDLKWIRWAVRGAVAWTAGLTGWFLKDRF